MRASSIALAAALVLGAGACSIGAEADDDTTGSDGPACAAGESSPDDFPDVLGVETEETDDGVWAFTVTMSSPYDTPERYADGWRVLGPGCTVYGIHTLTHDHASEQPFTRRQPGVAIPDDVQQVVIEGRDRVNGFGGAVVTVTLDRS